MRVSSCSFYCETKHLNKWTLNSGGLDQEIGNIGQYNAGQTFTRAYRISARDSQLVFLPSTCCTTNTSKYALTCKQR